MIQFIDKNEDLKEDERYMYSTKIDPSPLIKIKAADATPERWGSLTDKQFFDRFCDPEHFHLNEDNTEG